MVTFDVITYLFPMLSHEVATGIGVVLDIIFIVVGIILVRSAMRDEQKRRLK